MPQKITTLMSEQSTNPILASLKEINTPQLILVGGHKRLAGSCCINYFLCSIYCIALALIVRRYQNNAYRRAAIQELTKLDTNTQSQLALIPQILRSTALYAFERKQVSPLVSQKNGSCGWMNNANRDRFCG